MNKEELKILNDKIEQLESVLYTNELNNNDLKKELDLLILNETNELQYKYNEDKTLKHYSNQEKRLALVSSIPSISEKKENIDKLQVANHIMSINLKHKLREFEIEMKFSKVD